MRRRSFCALLVAVLMALVLVVGSASAASILLGGKKKKAATDPNLGDANNPVDITLDDGLRVEFKGVYLANPGNDHFHSAFIVTAPKDMVMKGNSTDIFDNRGNQFSFTGWIRIGNRDTSEREIIADAPTVVWFSHYGGGKDLRTFTRMKFWFNGKELTFRNVKLQDHAAYMEDSKTWFEGGHFDPDFNK